MDPATLIGVVASSIQIAQFIGTTIQSLHTLRGKFRDADTSIGLLIGQMSTIKAAIIQICDWAEFNSEDSPKEKRFLDGLQVSLEGCKVAMDVLAEEIKDLMVGTETSPGAVPPILGMRAKVRAIWNEDSMKAHQDRLSRQVQALQLLLTAGQCRDAMSQVRLLRLKENRNVIQRVADDTKTLRESQSSAASRAVGIGRQSTAGGTVFDFDHRVLATEPYRSVSVSRSTAQNVGVLPRIRRKPVGLANSGDDRGSNREVPMIERRHTVLPPTSPSRTGIPEARLPPDITNLSIHRRDSTTSIEPNLNVRRWLSSSARFPGMAESVSGPAKKKFWLSPLTRLNTFSVSKLSSTARRTKSAGAGFLPRQRQTPNRDTNDNQSIDITSIGGLETPAIVRDAQTGDLAMVETLLNNGNDIEARHTITERTALAVAAHCGNVEVVKLLLLHNAEVDARDCDLWTPLHLAASRSHCEVMEVLLQENADIEATNKSKQTPLWIAANRGHLKEVEILLAKGAKINARATDQLTALHTATKQGDTKMAELLLSHNAHIEARERNFMTALHYACETGHYLLAELLLQKGASIEALGKDSKTSLICAASSGNYQVVEFLLKRKASTKSLDDKGANALHWACRNGHLEITEHLLASKIPIHATDIYGFTPLHLAVVGSHFAVVDFLLQKNASVDYRCREGRTPLHYACGIQESDIVRLLLSAGAQPEAQVPGDDKRPIHIAAGNGSVEIVEALYQKGININARDSIGDRPLCITCKKGHIKVAERLLDYGEPLSMPFESRPGEDSPLCLAATAGHFEVVRLLLQKGAPVKQRDEHGYIPIRYAAYHGHPEVLQLLLEEGAEIIDDGEDSKGWGFVLMPDTVGFSDTSDISEERKQRVRDLLKEAKRNTVGRVRADSRGFSFLRRATFRQDRHRPELATHLDAGTDNQRWVSEWLHGSSVALNEEDYQSAVPEINGSLVHEMMDYSLPVELDADFVPETTTKNSRDTGLGHIRSLSTGSQASITSNVSHLSQTTNSQPHFSPIFTSKIDSPSISDAEGYSGEDERVVSTSATE